MELTWYGLGCFRITKRGYPAVLTDPLDEAETGLTLPKARVDIVTSSVLLDRPETKRWKGLRKDGHVLAGPGEYEIGGLFITSIATYRDRVHGAKLGQNVVYAMNFNNVVVCHLGALGSPLTQSQAESLGRVNVLLLPVGLPDGLTPSMASEVVSLIEPEIVVPMEYQIPGIKVPREPVTRFLKEMGLTHVSPLPSLKVTAGSLGEETQIVLLEPRRNE